jgi:glycosyltransferase involved in cell wall biosynthesis
MPRRNAVHRYGIVDSSSGQWTGGSIYSRTLIRSLAVACQGEGVKLYLLGNQGNDPEIEQLPVTVTPLKSPHYYRGEWRLRALLGLPEKSSLFETASDCQISVLLPVSDIPAKMPGIQVIGWIPDFQHLYLPHYFSLQECQRRNIIYRRLAEGASLVMLSSQNAMEHFAAFIPAQAHKARLVSFPSLQAFEPLPPDIVSARSRFHLPEKFALVANQFWQHKNHLQVVEALAHLRRKGVRIPLVMTGLPADYRDPSNRAISQVLQAIAAEGIGDQMWILGLVSASDLLSLMRTAAVVIQPSRFEGWSTTVQDAKALGRPLLCSDIPVHREQAPEALGFFPCDRPDILADLLASHWAALEPGPCSASEERARSKERDFAREHGRRLLTICQEADA